MFSSCFFYAGNIEKCPLTYSYWLNGRWFLQVVDIGNVLCPARLTGGTLCFRVVRPSVLLSVCPSVRHVLGVPLCVQHPAKTMPFQQIIMHALQCQHDLDVHLLFCVDLDLHIASSRGRV